MVPFTCSVVPSGPVYSLTHVLGVTHAQQRAQMHIRDISHAPLVCMRPLGTGARPHGLMRMVSDCSIFWLQDVSVFKGSYIHDVICGLESGDVCWSEARAFLGLSDPSRWVSAPRARAPLHLGLSHTQLPMSPAQLPSSFKTTSSSYQLTFLDACKSQESIQQQACRPLLDQNLRAGREGPHPALSASRLLGLMPPSE